MTAARRSSLTDLDWSVSEERLAAETTHKAPNGVAELARQLKTEALRAALLQHGAEPAMILVIMALMGAAGTVHIHREGVEPRDHPPDCETGREIFDKYRPLFEDCLDTEGPSGSGLRLRYWDDACTVKAFGILCAMDRQAVHELFTAVVASRIGCYFSYGAADDPLALALAKEFGAHVSSSRWQMDETFLQGCKKSLLLQIAVELGLDADEAKTKTKADCALANLTSKALRRLILKHLETHSNARSYLPPPLRFCLGEQQEPASTTTIARSIA